MSANSIDAIQSQILQGLEAVQRECALAMEQAHADAFVRTEARVEAARQEGKQEERERILLLIALQLEHLREDGSNAMALHALRRSILGEA